MLMRKVLIVVCVFFPLLMEAATDLHLNEDELPRVSVTISPIPNSSLGVCQKFEVFPGKKKYTISLSLLQLRGDKNEGRQCLFTLPKANNHTYEWVVENGYLCISRTQDKKIIMKILMTVLDESYQKANEVKK